jgi:protein-S-isoprenylcysteine O-methyltransferase Ste14
MARPAFKRMLTRVIPAAAERSTYVLASSLALALLFWKWEPLGGTIWNVEAPSGRAVLYAGYAFGWGLVLFSTFVINHFDLFGLRQVWRHINGQQQAKVQFTVPFLYRIVRHPLYVGWLFAFWSTPTMTVTHLLFAIMTTAYILIAVRFEEADLAKEHPQYAAYRKQVPMLLPRLTREVTLQPSRDSVRIATLVAACLAMAATASAQLGTLKVPPMPDNLALPAGHMPYMKTSATGTQNYICLPGANGPAWTFQGPQATVYLVFPWFGKEVRQQVMTHFLSANPAEEGRARPAWHHSGDSSTVWGKATADSVDPTYVKPNSIAWLRVEIAGSERGPMGGSAITETTYIHRLNTSGGIKPTTGCDESAYGRIAFVPYTTDYYFYRRAN